MNIKKTGVEKLDAEAASKNLYGITVPIITAETTEEEGRIIHVLPSMPYTNSY